MPPRPEFLKHIWGAAATILTTLAVQTGGAIYWAGSIHARVTLLEKNCVRMEERFHEHEIAQMMGVSPKPIVSKAPGSRMQ